MHFMIARITVDDTRCSGCRACEVACVAWHDSAFGTSTARIRVNKVESRGKDTPVVCQKCDDKPCIAACPVDALSTHSLTGAVCLDTGACIVCSACADACEFQAVSAHPVTGLPLICDLCEGDPACVKRCATGALSWGAAHA